MRVRPPSAALSPLSTAISPSAASSSARMAPRISSGDQPGSYAPAERTAAGWGGEGWVGVGGLWLQQGQGHPKWGGEAWRGALAAGAHLGRP
jgi:hypothetical protein